MFSTVLKCSILGVATLAVTACANPAMVPKQSFIEKVQVDVKPEVASATIGPQVAGVMRRDATRFGREGAAKELKITVTRLHYRNAVTAALVGDADTLKAHVAVVDVANRTAHGEFEVEAVIAPGGGLTGVFLTMMYDKQKADAQLSLGLSRMILDRVYGTEVAQAAQSKPVLEPVPAAPSEPSSHTKPSVAPAAGPKISANATRAHTAATATPASVLATR